MPQVDLCQSGGQALRPPGEHRQRLLQQRHGQRLTGTAMAGGGVSASLRYEGVGIKGTFEPARIESVGIRPAVCVMERAEDVEDDVPTFAQRTAEHVLLLRRAGG